MAVEGEVANGGCLVAGGAAPRIVTPLENTHYLLSGKVALTDGPVFSGNN